MRKFLVALAVSALTIGATFAKTVRLVALGDSLTAGYRLPPDAAFPAMLEKALRGAGYDVRISNAGVSGDTAEDGLARLDAAIRDNPDGVILELGANDMLRGLDPSQTRQTLDRILAKLSERYIKVLVTGELALPYQSGEYRRAFNAIYPALAAKYNVPFYPFFLQGVRGNTSRELDDGHHPNPDGVQAIVTQMLPLAESFVRAISVSQ